MGQTFLGALRLRWWLAAVLAVARLAASSCTVSPARPVSGQLVTVTYDRTGGPLAAAGVVYVHRAINQWSALFEPDQPLRRDPATGLDALTFLCPEPAYDLSFAFNSGGNNPTWDNNATKDWHFPVTPGPPPAVVPVLDPRPDNASRARVMMQGFYWDVPAGGTWYDTMAAKAAALRDMQGGQGVDRVWFPPPAKSESGALSMGYDPYDYYDLGAYAQKGTVATRFGTQAQLRAAIAALRAQGILAMADVVPNHRSGGALENNPISGTAYYTDFSRVASGRAAWRYDAFHPNALEASDGSAFGGFPDVALGLVMPNAPGSPRYDLIEWGNWLADPANAGFTGGWRFDFVKGYRPSFVAEFRQGTGSAFGVMEYWDGNVANVEANARFAGGTATFDFPGYYTLRDLCNAPAAGNVANLVNRDRTFVARNAALAVTFVANHDTDEIVANKLLAYAFILTFEGYPCLFWKDYFDRGLATFGGQAGNGLNPLVWARGALAGGRPKIEVLKGDAPDLLIYGTATGSRNSPGYLVVLNTHPTATRTATVTTSDPLLRGTKLRAYAFHSAGAAQNTAPADVVSAADGTVTLAAPPLGYAVFGPATLFAETGFDPPVLTAHPAAATIAPGGAVRFSAAARGTGVSYQWLKNGAPLAGATTAALALANVQTADAGEYAVDVTNQGGTVRSRPAGLTVASPVAGSIVNLSARSVTGRDGLPLIVGFNVVGSAKRILLRASGPALVPYGVAGALDDPVLRLHSSPGAAPDVVLAENDNWGSGGGSVPLAAAFAGVGAFAWPEPASRDAALVHPVAGVRTATVDPAVTGRSGVVLVEAYDTEPTTTSARLGNVSIRNFAGQGSETLIAGFVISGNTPRRILIRGAGPVLAQFGVAGVLADPQLELHWASPTGDRIVAANDNWADEAGVAAMSAAAGAFAFPPGSPDSALLVTLTPGQYTCQLTGAEGGTGVALLELYDVTGLAP